MRIKDRIRELRRVPASELRPNPKNWRTHPKEQADALRGTLAEIGFAEAIVARELPDGTLEIIDGHLRAETAANAKVPVLVLDVTEEEADKLLATLDPLASMATVDSDKLAELVASIEIDSEALKAAVDELMLAHGPIPDKHRDQRTINRGGEVELASEDFEHKCPRCGFEFNEPEE
jgi:hypothetical protein